MRDITYISSVSVPDGGYGTHWVDIARGEKVRPFQRPTRTSRQRLSTLLYENSEWKFTPWISGVVGWTATRNPQVPDGR